MNAAPFINLFNGKTRVTFIHAITGKLIGVHKMKPEQLPVAFNKPTSIDLQGTTWRVVQAEPVHAKEFTINNKLTLHVQEETSINPVLIHAGVPTICSDQPVPVSEPLFTDFLLEITEYRWHQHEFFPLTLLPVVQEEMLQVESFLLPVDGINTLLGYQNIYRRKIARTEPLSISLNEFCECMSIRERGGIRLPADGFVQNGIALRSDNYIYYGVVKDGVLEELCLDTFESVDEEFCGIASAYDLVLADWCNGKIIMA